MRGRLLLASLLAALPPGTTSAQEGKPLPVGRTAKLQEAGSVYTVEGRVRIPKGVEITIYRDTIVRAKGSAPAVIEVEGDFDAVGTFGKEVIFEGVTVEPQARFARIRMDMVLFRGGGGLRTPKDVAADGALLADNVDVLKGGALDLLWEAGSVELLSTCCEEPMRIRTRRPEGVSREQVRISVQGCDQGRFRKCTPHARRIGLKGGLEVDGGDDVTLVNSRTAGPLTAVRNWGRRLIFDAMKVNSTRLEFSHREAGHYAAVQCAKCDIYASQVRASAPPSDRGKDPFTMDRCWFKGLTDPKAIQDKVIGDGSDDPAHNGVRVLLPKVSERALELAGEEDR